MHDKGIRGLSHETLRRVMRTVEDRVRLFISGEKPLPAEFEHLRYPIAPEKMHHALARAEFFLGDSQTMTSEAALVGTPALRINDFVGRLSYLEEIAGYGLSPAIRMTFLEDGDHSFKPRVRSGRTLDQNMNEAVTAVSEFM